MLAEEGGKAENEEPFITAGSTQATNATEENQKDGSVFRKKAASVWADMTKRHLVWVKAVFFLQTAANVTLYPFLTLHLRSLGFSVRDASAVNTAIPLADVIGPPLAGLVADKLGNFRLLMAAVTFLNGAASLGLLTVAAAATEQQGFVLRTLVACSADGNKLEIEVISVIIATQNYY